MMLNPIPYLRDIPKTLGEPVRVSVFKPASQGWTVLAVNIDAELDEFFCRLWENYFIDEPLYGALNV